MTHPSSGNFYQQLLLSRIRL